MKKIFVISLGGSLVSPEAGKVDAVFLEKFRALILKYVKRGHRFAIIVGGGKICRAWQDALRQLTLLASPSPGLRPPSPRGRGEGEGQMGSDPSLREGRGERGLRDELDWVGIRATQLNAEIVRAMFGNVAHAAVVQNPAQKVGEFCVLIGAGYVPGHSSDYDAVVRAKNVGARTVVNLSNVPYVYDKDPGKFKDAKILECVSWTEYRKMFGTKWVPGANVPFDQKAASEAARADMQVVFLGGHDLKNFEQFLQGKEFKGTVIG